MYFAARGRQNNNQGSSNFQSSFNYSRPVRSQRESQLIAKDRGRFNHELRKDKGDCAKTILRSSKCLDHQQRISNDKFEPKHILTNPVLSKNMDDDKFSGNVATSNKGNMYQDYRQNDMVFSAKCINCDNITRAVNVKCPDCIKIDALNNFKNLERSEVIAKSEMQANQTNNFHRKDNGAFPVSIVSTFGNGEEVIRKLNQGLRYNCVSKKNSRNQTCLFTDDDVKKIVSSTAGIDINRNTRLKNSVASEIDSNAKKLKETASRKLKCGANLSKPFVGPFDSSGIDIISEGSSFASDDLRSNSNNSSSGRSKIGANFENRFDRHHNKYVRKSCDLKKEDFFDLYTELKGNLKFMKYIFDNLTVEYEKILNQIAELVRNSAQDDPKTQLIGSEANLEKTTFTFCDNLGSSLNILKKLVCELKNPEIIGDSATMPLSEDSLNFDISPEPRSGASMPKASGEKLPEHYKKPHKKYNSFPGNLRSQYQAYKRGLSASDNPVPDGILSQIFETLGNNGKENSASHIDRSFKMTKNSRKRRFEVYTRPKTRNDQDKILSKLDSNACFLNSAVNLAKSSVRFQASESFKIECSTVERMFDKPVVSRGTKVSQYFSSFESQSEDQNDGDDEFEDSSDGSLLLDEIPRSIDDFIGYEEEISVDNEISLQPTMYISSNDNTNERADDILISQNNDFSHIGNVTGSETFIVSGSEAQGIDDIVTDDDENYYASNEDISNEERLLQCYSEHQIGSEEQRVDIKNDEEAIDSNSLAKLLEIVDGGSDEVAHISFTDNLNNSESPQYRLMHDLLKCHMWPEGYTSTNIMYWESAHDQLYNNECIDLIKKSFNFLPATEYSAIANPCRMPPGFEEKTYQNLSNLPTIPWIPINSILMDIVVPRRVPKIPPGFENVVPIPRHDLPEITDQIDSMSGQMKSLAINDTHVENEDNLNLSDGKTLAIFLKNYYEKETGLKFCENDVEPESDVVAPLLELEPSESVDTVAKTKPNNSSGNGNEGRKSKVAVKHKSKKKKNKSKKKSKKEKNRKNCGKTKNVIKNVCIEKIEKKENVADKPVSDKNSPKKLQEKIAKKELPKELFVQIESRCGKLPSLINVGVANNTPSWTTRVSPWAPVRNFMNRDLNASSIDIHKCSLCLFPLNGPDTRQFSCNHHFHERCVNNAFDSNGKCPVCRLRIIMDIDFPPLRKY